MSVTPEPKGQPPKTPILEHRRQPPKDPRPAVDAESREETAAEPSGEKLVVADRLVEDVSIDGMCGVY
jgi:mycofactocin precursor